MFENLKELLENASEETLREMSESMEKHLEIDSENKEWIYIFQEIVDEYLEQNFRPEDTTYELICENSQGESSESGTLSELISSNKPWLESYLPSKHKSRAYSIKSIEELVELLNISYEGTYWSDTEYSFALA